MRVSSRTRSPQTPPEERRACRTCGKSFAVKQPAQQYCSHRCVPRNTAFRLRRKPTVAKHISLGVTKRDRHAAAPRGSWWTAYAQGDRRYDGFIAEVGRRFPSATTDRLTFQGSGSRDAD